MYPLGHVGVTLAAALATLYLLERPGRPGSPEGRRPPAAGGSVRRAGGSSVRLPWSRQIDLRFVILGALLPDIVDKILGHVILAGSLDNGRLIAHTLLFGLVLLGVGVGRRSANIVALSLADMAHLAEDLMWLMPETLLWPLHGLAFPAEEFEVYDWVTSLLTDHYVQAGEIVGACLLTAIALRYRLLDRPRLSRFLRTGRLEVVPDYA